MSATRVWRRLLLALCALTFVVFVSEATASEFLATTSGITVDSTRPAFIDHILVRPGSPAARAGLRDGDTIDRRLADPATRFGLTTGYWTLGDRADVPVERSGQLLHVTVVPEHLPIPLAWNLAYLGFLWLVAFATIVVVRRPDSIEARILATLFLLFVLSTTTYAGIARSPWPAFDACLNALSAVLYPTTFVLFTVYTTRFGQPMGLTRRVFAWLSCAVATGSAMFGVASIAGAWFGTVDPNGPIFGSAAIFCVNNLAPFAFAFVCGVLALAASRGVERTHLAWALGPVAIFYGINCVVNLMQYFYPVDPTLVNPEDVALDLTILVVPAVLTYSILSRRLLDIGFALNRAAVFAATTLLLAGLFAALQWIANVTLTSLSRSHDVLVQVTIAVVVFYVVRLSRDRTDRIVTRLFFLSRERRIGAIRELASGVDEVRAAGDIGAFVTGSLRLQASIEASVLLESDAGDYVPAHGSPPDAGVMAQNDLTIVSLRSRRRPITVMDGPLTGATAFPMLVRGQVRGVLICAVPENEDAFAPDETRVLFELATTMASARDDLLSEALRHELQTVREHNIALQARLATLDLR